MKYYFLITALLCIIYYFLLVWHSRKLRSTFAVFWLFTGGVHLIAGCAPLPVYIYKILGILCVLGWMCFLFTEFCIVTGMFCRNTGKTDCIIVLGAQVKGTKITDSLKRRLDRALLYLESFPDTTVIVSGGRGPGEQITEAEAMAGYLIQNGIDAAHIIKENKSVSTRENLKYSRKFLDPRHDSVGIVTNGFHMYRAVLIAEQEGYYNIRKIPASSNPVFQLNYLVREFFAVLQVWTAKKRKRKYNGRQTNSEKQ